MEYLDQARRESLVRAKNDLGETPLHLAVSFTGGAAAGSNGGSGEEAKAEAGRGGGGSGSGSRRGGVSKREADVTVQVRYDTIRHTTWR